MSTTTLPPITTSSSTSALPPTSTRSSKGGGGGTGTGTGTGTCAGSNNGSNGHHHQSQRLLVVYKKPPPSRNVNTTFAEGAFNNGNTQQVQLSQHPNDAAEAVREQHQYELMLSQFNFEAEKSREKQLVERSWLEMQELKRLELEDNWRREQEKRRIIEREIDSVEDHEWKMALTEQRRRAHDEMKAFEMKLSIHLKTQALKDSEAYERSRAEARDERARLLALRDETLAEQRRKREHETNELMRRTMEWTAVLEKSRLELSAVRAARDIDYETHRRTMEEKHRSLLSQKQREEREYAHAQKEAARAAMIVKQRQAVLDDAEKQRHADKLRATRDAEVERLRIVNERVVRHLAVDTGLDLGRESAVETKRIDRLARDADIALTENAALKQQAADDQRERATLQAEIARLKSQHTAALNDAERYREAAAASDAEAVAARAAEQAQAAKAAEMAVAKQAAERRAAAAKRAGFSGGALGDGGEGDSVVTQTSFDVGTGKFTETTAMKTTPAPATLTSMCPASLGAQHLRHSASSDVCARCGMYVPPDALSAK